MSSNVEYYTGYEDDDESSIENEDEPKSSDEEDEKDFKEFLISKNLKTKTTINPKEAAACFENEMNNHLDKLVRDKEKELLAEINKLNGTSSQVDQANGEQPKLKSILKKTRDGDAKKPEEAIDQAASASSKSEKKEDIMESDTDSEAELETGVRTKKKREHFTNDELFYDPNLDDKDEEWINEKRKSLEKTKQSPKSEVQQAGTSSQPKSKDSKSDAILNCPCCMSLITMDCQRHDKYKTQYRTMFVFNCKIKQDEQLKFPKEKLKRRGSGVNQAEANDHDLYKPVECDICKTEIGVYDENEEIYHLFNILASHS